MTQPTKRPDTYPIGYQEFQAAWVGDKTDAEIEAYMADLRAKIVQEAPGTVEHNVRYESAKDGAGVEHHHLYIGVAPAVAAAPPLGNNMNDAPLPRPGFGPAVEDTTLPIGYKEEKFGRGT